MPVERDQMLSHYRLIEQIGEGGMGVVWKAQDQVLNRLVAIKVLPADVSQDRERREMFFREAKVASSLSDAHIVQVYEFGRERDLDFIVMEYVDGKPLTRLIHGQPLPVDKVAEIGLQVARALARAHHKGLVHRDLKPANILVTDDGEVKVVDFGLAALYEPSDASIESADVTRTVAKETVPPEERSGPSLVGTVPYMAPEQFQRKRLDARSDVFSLGSVLYEMTTGHRPFAGATASEIAREILQARPVPPQDVVPKLPLELGRIIQKALARRRSDRYQSMDDLAVDLRRLLRDLESGSSPSFEDLTKITPGPRWRPAVIVLAAAAIVVAAAVGAWRLLPRSTPPVSNLTVVPLPLKVVGQQEGADYLGRTFAEALAINLAQYEDLTILAVPDPAPPDAASAYEQARSRGAGLVLTGTIAREASEITASVALLDSSSHRVLWGAEWRAPVADAGVGNGPSLSPLSSLVTRAAGGIAAELGFGPKRYDHPYSLTGSRAMTQSPTLSHALGSLQRYEVRAALEASEKLRKEYPEEPDAGVIHVAALALAFAQDPSQDSRSELERALSDLSESEPGSPYVAIYRAWLWSEYDGFHESALTLFGQILQRDDLTNAARAWVLRMRSTTLTNTDKAALALDDLAEAHRLDPLDPSTLYRMSRALRRLGRHEDAVVRARQAVALNSSDWLYQFGLGVAHHELGRFEDSVAPFRRSCDLSRNQVACAALAAALLKSGKSEEATTEAVNAAALGESLYGTYNLACFWALAGDPDAAIRYLQRSLALGFADLVIVDEKDLASLRGNPQYEAIVSEVRKRSPSRDR